jgi:hypothetical protein
MVRQIGMEEADFNRSVDLTWHVPACREQNFEAPAEHTDGLATIRDHGRTVGGERRGRLVRLQRVDNAASS